MILILGAGPTGLGAAYRLSQLDVNDWFLVESQEKAGGLASSFLDANGFTWDVGGHIEFSHYTKYDGMVNEVLGNERLWHNRKALIKMSDRLVPYPFQHNLHRLNPEDRERAIAMLEAAQSQSVAVGSTPTFLDWIYTTFGSGIAELFMVPYNRKVWGYPLETIDCGWVGDRVPIPDLSRVRRITEDESDNENWGPNSRFWYPLRGGAGATWANLSASLNGRNMQFGVHAVSVDLSSHTVLLSDGRSLRWDVLISTIPLDRLCAMAHGLEQDVQLAARSLMHSSCHIIGIGCKGEMPSSLSGVSWIYFPSAEVPQYRVTVLSNYSPHNAPDGCWSLLAEVSETAQMPLTSNDLVADVVRALRRDKLLPENVRLVSLWHRFFEYGYPTPFMGRDNVLDRILPLLACHGVYSRGRFGAWKYEVSNQDHSFMQGVELIEVLMGVGVELTIWHPNQVNRMRSPVTQAQQ